MKDELVSMYMAAFSEQELNEINAFYNTPTGKKLIQNLPDLIQQRDRLAMQRLQANLGELEQEIQTVSGQRIQRAGHNSHPPPEQPTSIRIAGTVPTSPF